MSAIISKPFFALGFFFNAHTWDLLSKMPFITAFRFFFSASSTTSSVLHTIDLIYYSTVKISEKVFHPCGASQTPLRILAQEHGITFKARCVWSWEILNNFTFIPSSFVMIILIIFLSQRHYKRRGPRREKEDKEKKKPYEP